MQTNPQPGMVIASHCTLFQLSLPPISITSAQNFFGHTNHNDEEVLFNYYNILFRLDGSCPG
jgi:hypothetical protein